MDDRTEKATNLFALFIILILVLFFLIPDYLDLGRNDTELTPEPQFDINPVYFLEKPNFELRLNILIGSRLFESFALYTKQALTPLGIDLKLYGKPYDLHIADILDER
ncbi:MAG: hypothetical protein GPJ54_03190 [Candidatus Heimdallarchaeota archaeon]|nr:hypothetical protein [Candidatus Heimdallarchaeota archaeon]